MYPTSIAIAPTERWLLFVNHNENDADDIIIDNIIDNDDNDNYDNDDGDDNDDNDNNDNYDKENRWW